MLFAGIDYGSYLDVDNCRVSVDNMRLRFCYNESSYSFNFQQSYDTMAYYRRKLQACDWSTLGCGFKTEFFVAPAFRIGGYQIVVRVECDYGSFSLLIGRFTFSGSKLVVPEIILDYNPNKIPGYLIRWFYDFLSNGCKSVDVVRFDLAFDYPLPRNEVFLVQDMKRGYRLFREHSAVTEYQGKRNTNGALKIYDKTAELGLVVDVTRVEITVDGDFSGQIEELFPRLHRFSTQLDFNLFDADFAVAACVLYPDLIDVLRATVSRNTYKRYYDAIKDFNQVSLVPTDWNSIHGWVASFILGVVSGDFPTI